jgi:hypothetical protein
MNRLSSVHLVVAVHATCAGTNLVLALIWSSWVLALFGAGWALVAALLFAFREDSRPESGLEEPPEVRPDEPVALPGS